MKFYISDVEIKTVNKNATIEGSLSLVARTAHFSYIYNPDDPDFKMYKAKTGSGVLIKDGDERIFKGNITEVHYNPDKGIVEITAQDLFSILLSKKIFGRFSGAFSYIAQKLLKGYNINFNINLDALLYKKTNIVSFGKLSLYDILHAAVLSACGDNFKLYIDGNSRINVLVPLAARSKGEFTTGLNIISASFTSQMDYNTARITAIGNNDVVAGSVIHVNETKSGAKGYFLVQRDRHIYTDTHIMELDLKERKFV